MERKVIGAVGKNGTGKDTVLDIIADKYGVPSISMGDIVRDIARSKGIELTRPNLNKISKEHFEKHGPDYFIKLVIERIDQSNAPFMLVTGIRTHLDAKSLSDHFGDDFLLIHVIVSEDEERLRRALARNTPRDPKTLEELREHDAREEKIFGIEKAATLATTTVKNDADLKALEDETVSWVTTNLPGLKQK